MSGHDIPLPVLLAAFVATCAVAWCAAGRQRGIVAIAGGQVAAQGALHVLFAKTQPMTGMATASDPMSMPTPMPAMTCGARYAHLVPDPPDSHAMHAMPGMAGMAGMDSMAGAADQAQAAAMDAAAHTMSGGMLAAHLLAALICGIWLWRGEAAAFRLARAVGALGVLAARPLRRALALVRTCVPAPPRAVRGPRPHHRPRPGLRGAVHSHAFIRRGPPARGLTRATAPGRPALA
ncbi:hypothetical protein [Streptomyces sp. HUAS TT7]|uniref:hypothetical protein n=1 Tax=Streptomyces sp. HUAS TT7 TaxID=3447507 RepID=UPI003F65C946